MNYYEACEQMLERYQVEKVIRRHCLDPSDFFAEFGICDEYLGQDLLDWLGY